MAEQRYQAVLAVIGEGGTVTEVAGRWGVSRHSVHTWLARYEACPCVEIRGTQPNGWPLSGTPILAPSAVGIIVSGCDACRRGLSRGSSDPERCRLRAPRGSCTGLNLVILPAATGPSARDLRHGAALADHSQNRLIPLLSHAHLRHAKGVSRISRSSRKESARTTVRDQPKARCQPR